MGGNNVRATGGEEHCETLSSKYDMTCIIKKGRTKGKGHQSNRSKKTGYHLSSEQTLKQKQKKRNDHIICSKVSRKIDKIKNFICSSKLYLPW